MASTGRTGLNATRCAVPALEHLAGLVSQTVRNRLPGDNTSRSLPPLEQSHAHSGLLDRVVQAGHRQQSPVAGEGVRLQVCIISDPSSTGSGLPVCGQGPPSARLSARRPACSHRGRRRGKSSGRVEVIRRWPARSCRRSLVTSLDPPIGGSEGVSRCRMGRELCPAIDVVHHHLAILVDRGQPPLPLVERTCCK